VHAAGEHLGTGSEGSRVETIDDQVSPSSTRLLWRRRQVIRRDSVFRRALGLADMTSIVVALGVTSLLSGDDVNWAIVAVPPLFVLLCKALGLYDRDEHLIHKTTLDEIPALFGIATLSALLLVFSDGLFISGGLGRGDVLAAWVLLFLLLVCLRSLARWSITRALPPERCLLVGDPVRATAFREKLRMTQSVRAELVGYVPAAVGPAVGANGEIAAFADLEPVLVSKSIDRVVLAPPADGGGDDELLYIIRELKSHGVKVSVLPEASRMAGSSVEPDYLTGLTLLGVKRFEFGKSSQLIKRGIDILLSAIALIVLAPLFAVIAVAIKLDSHGPVLFRQVRAGRRGKGFEMLKFRSMIDGAERLKEDLRHLNEADGIFKISDDPRITRVGRLLRRTHFDELPQLINVLKGDMSLVGPRPLPLDEDEAIRGWYRDRLEVPPGISGYWQVLGSSRIPLEEMVKLDYLYIANWSVWGDLKLMLRTVAVVVKRRGM